MCSEEWLKFTPFPLKKHPHHDLLQGFGGVAIVKLTMTIVLSQSFLAIGCLAPCSWTTASDPLCWTTFPNFLKPKPHWVGWEQLKQFVQHKHPPLPKHSLNLTQQHKHTPSPQHSWLTQTYTWTPIQWVHENGQSWKCNVCGCSTASSTGKVSAPLVSTDASSTSCLTSSPANSSPTWCAWTLSLVCANISRLYPEESEDMPFYPLVF